MIRETGNGNDLIPLVTHFRQALEIVEFVLIEGASFEPAPDDEIATRTTEYMEQARNTRLEITLTVPGKKVTLKCRMIVEETS